MLKFTNLCAQCNKKNPRLGGVFSAKATPARKTTTKWGFIHGWLLRTNLIFGGILATCIRLIILVTLASFSHLANANFWTVSTIYATPIPGAYVQPIYGSGVAACTSLATYRWQQISIVKVPGTGRYSCKGYDLVRFTFGFFGVVYENNETPPPLPSFCSTLTGKNAPFLLELTTKDENTPPPYDGCHIGCKTIRDTADCFFSHQTEAPFTYYCKNVSYSYTGANCPPVSPTPPPTPTPLGDPPATPPAIPPVTPPDTPPATPPATPPVTPPVTPPADQGGGTGGAGGSPPLTPPTAGGGGGPTGGPAASGGGGGGSATTGSGTPPPTSGNPIYTPINTDGSNGGTGAGIGGDGVGGGGTGGVAGCTAGAACNDFCDTHPDSIICKATEFSAHCNSDGTSQITCEGDAIQCSIAQQQANTDCKLFTQDEQMFSKYEQAKNEGSDNSPIKQGANEPINIKTTLNENGTLSRNCFPDATFSLLGTSFNLPISVYCPYFEAFGYILLSMAYLAAARIIGT